MRLRSSAFQMWKNFTEYEKEMADLASVMSNRNSTLRFKTSIQHWLQYAKLHRATKTAYDRVIAKRKRTAMLDSWIAWRQLVADEFARQAKIRACIRSKRVMKDWFVNWYWDAYEDEIRSTLKLLYGTTEDVLGQLYDMYEEMRQADSKNDDVPVRPASTSQSLEAPPISGDPGPNLCILNELQNVDTAEEFCTPTLWSDELEGAKLSRPSPRKELSFN